MQASFQRQQHIDPRLYVLAPRQGQSTYWDIWKCIKCLFIYSCCEFLQNFSRSHSDISLTRKASLWSLWGGSELMKWTDWQVTLACYSQTDVLASVWVHFVVPCPLFSLQLLICLLSFAFLSDACLLSLAKNSVLFLNLHSCTSPVQRVMDRPLLKPMNTKKTEDRQKKVNEE